MLLAALLCFTVYRVTRLIIADSIPFIAVPRTWLLEWWDPEDPTRRPHWGAFGRSLRYLFTCPWCMSVWVGAAIVWGTDQLILDVPLPWLVWATASAVTGLLAGLEEKLG